jgi:hypothetical protein
MEVKTMLNNNDMLMDWDDAIENDGQEFYILPEGDYNFTVVDFERGRFPGSAKLPACNKATLTLQVNTTDGTATIKTDLILYRSLECEHCQQVVKVLTIPGFKLKTVPVFTLQQLSSRYRATQ